MGFNEANTIQKALIDWAKGSGWSHVRGEDLPRLDNHEVVVETWAVEAVRKFNPDLDADDEGVQNVLAEVKAAVLSAGNEGLVRANETLTTMLRGSHSFKDIATDKHLPRTFIDFENPSNNRLVVSDEVTIGSPGKARRFDVVYYVNGFPLAVIETKTPVKAKVTWLNGACDIHDVYEQEYPNFFAPNVLIAATDGLEFRFGAVRQSPTEWNVWGSTDSVATLHGPERVELSARLLLHPETLLDVLKDFTLFRHATAATETDKKFLPRYPQVEAANAIHDKVLAGRPGGLIWHYQGSGKTLLTVFASLKLLNDDRAGSPTVIILVDRKDLVRQTSQVFRTAGMPRLMTPKDMRELQKLLKRDERGVIITTIHKFRDAGFLNGRDNIIVMVDEAHRTQEGTLGKDLRTALPNARFYGMTGTPVSAKDRNTFRLFGDPDDPDFVMSRYEPTRSIVDETTVPVLVEARLVQFNVDQDGLDEAFEELAEVEGLDDDAKVFLASKTAHIRTLLLNPDRITAVCADIVDHFHAHLAPLGQKAQVVAYDRELVVAYTEAVKAEITRRGLPYEVALNMHVTNSKDEKQAFKKYAMSEPEEEAQKARFLNVKDPLSFLVVTSKLMTGFDAPLEGVLYLDKPLKAHTLFQTITRPNRTWTNPLTGQRKTRGLVVDYVGLARAIGKALIDPSADAATTQVVDVNELAGTFVTKIEELLEIFDGIDLTDTSFASLAAARSRISTSETRENFVKQFIGVQTVWEFLDPHKTLNKYRAEYRWLAQVYETVKPAGNSNLILWEKLGQKTLDLVHANMSGIQIEYRPKQSVKLDPAGIALIKGLAAQGELPGLDDNSKDITLEDVLDTIEKRVKRRMTESDSPVYQSLAKQIERLRDQAIKNADQSIEFLKRALGIAQQVVKADRMEADGELEGNESLFDPNIGALTQIVEENQPEGLHLIVMDVVTKIDTIVKQVAYTGWNESIPGDKAVRRELRNVITDFGFPPSGTVFDRAYEYVKENY
jgi:type I restriction enzyme R subunit